MLDITHDGHTGFLLKAPKVETVTKISPTHESRRDEGTAVVVTNKKANEMKTNQKRINVPFVIFATKHFHSETN